MAPSTAPPIQHIAERKCKITGRIQRIGEVQETRNKTGFRQHIWLHIDALKDEMTKRVIRREEYYQIEIFSKDRADSRFLSAKNMSELVCCCVYLNSWHFVSAKDGLVLGMRLSFVEWLKVDK